MNLPIGTKVKIKSGLYAGRVTEIIESGCGTPDHCYNVNIDHFIPGEGFNVDKNEVEEIED